MGEPEEYPEHWASVQLNLANSLVYTPSDHQADNLIEAVGLYESVLAARDRHSDPLGRARVLANQGNVFAHLGDFDQAKAKLYGPATCSRNSVTMTRCARFAVFSMRSPGTVPFPAPIPESADPGDRTGVTGMDTGTPSFEALAKRVDDAVAALDDLDPAARRVADELQAAIEDVHKAGLLAIVRRLRADEAGRATLFELVDDPVVHLLLSLHGIIRPDPVTHANQVLAAVRPQLHSHGGDVALVRVADGTAFVRLEGACNGCSMSSVTLRNLVEDALVHGVPAITAVEVVAGAADPDAGPVESLRVGRDPAAQGWVRLGPAARLPVGELTVAAPASGWRRRGDRRQPRPASVGLSQRMRP